MDIRAVLRTIQSDNVGMHSLRLGVAALLTRVMGIGFLFGSNIVLARVLGKADYGIYSFGVVIASILGAIATLGLGASATRFLPLYVKDGAFSLQRGFVIFAILGASISGVISAAFFFVLFSLLPEILPGIAPILSGMLVGVSLLSLSSSLTEVMRAYTWSVHAVMANSVVLPALTASGCYWFWLHGHIDANIATWIGAASLFVTISIQLMTFYKRLQNTEVATSIAEYRSRLWLTTGLPLSWAFATSLITFYSETTLVAYFLRSEDLGVYRVVTQIAYLLAFIPSTVYSAIGGLLSREFHSDRSVFVATVRKIHALICVVLLVLGVVILIASKWVLGMFGPGFDQGQGALVIIVCFSLLRLTLGPSELVLMLGGRGRERFIVEILALSLSIGGGIILIPRFGLEGAAIIHSITWLFSALSLRTLAYRTMGIQVLPFNLRFEKR